jgi:hypothetical protein
MNQKDKNRRLSRNQGSLTGEINAGYINTVDGRTGDRDTGSRPADCHRYNASDSKDLGIQDLSNQVLSKQILSDLLLTERLTNLTLSERSTTLELLVSLAEFDNRKLFSATHSSLFSYATKQLKMSEGEAQRRIDGARLLRSFPEFIKQYQSGDLNLTHASLLRRHFRTEARIQKKNLSRKVQLELLQKLLGKSTREAERILVAVSSRPELQKPTSQYEKLLKNGNYRVQFEARPELLAKTERLKEVWSHAMSGASWPELIERAFDMAIERCDPHAKAERNHLRQHQCLEKARHCEAQEHQKLDQKLVHSTVESTVHKQNSISEPDIISCSGADNNVDVDPITGEIQLRLPLSVNATQSEVKSQLARVELLSPFAPTVELPSNRSRGSRTTFMPLGPSKFSSAIPLVPKVNSHAIPLVSVENSRSTRTTPSKRSSANPITSNKHLPATVPIGNSKYFPTLPLTSNKRSRTIPSAIRHAVWWRDNGQCTFVYPNGKICGERMGLEIDHIKAFVYGGEHTIENLRLRCRQHNAYHCIKTFGRSVVRTGAAHRA